MRIAVTGATGVLGQYVVKELSQDHDCLLLGRSIEKLNSTFKIRSRYRLFAVDYSIHSLESALTDVQSLVHLAGLRPGDGVNGPEIYRENVRITGNVFEACGNLGITNVVFASSGSVYTTGIDSLPFIEDRDVSPSSFYAAGKVAMEKLGCVFGLKLKSLRVASIIGIGENPGYMRMAFIYRARRCAPLIILGDGADRREYIYGKDAARAISLALEKPELAAVINIGSGESVSHWEYANKVNQVFAGGKSEIIIKREKVGDVESYLMSSKKALELLDFKPEFDLVNTLNDLKRDMDA